MALAQPLANDLKQGVVDRVGEIDDFDTERVDTIPSRANGNERLIALYAVDGELSFIVHRIDRINDDVVPTAKDL
jgi:chemotaxis signal transduction protein